MLKVTELGAKLDSDRWVLELNQSGKYRFQRECSVKSMEHSRSQLPAVDEGWMFCGPDLLLCILLPPGPKGLLIPPFLNDKRLQSPCCTAYPLEEGEAATVF